MTTQTSPNTLGFVLTKNVPATQQSSLYQEAAQAAAGDDGSNYSAAQETAWSQAVPIGADSPIAGSIVDYKLEAYYMPTGELFDFTGLINNLQWTEAQATAAASGTLILFNGDGQVAQYANRPGLILFFSTAGVNGVMGERERWFVQESDVTDLTQGSLTQTFFDNLWYLQTATASFAYVPDQNHPHGWTASEIAVDICQKFGIPVNFIVQTTHRIKYFVSRQLSLYDAIAQAFTLDYRATGKFFYITMVKGQLQIRRPRVRNTLLAIDVDINLSSAQMTRTLPTDFATAALPAGAAPDPVTGKRISNQALTAAAATPGTQAAKTRANVRALAQLTSPPPTSLASSVLFGNVIYDGGRDRIGSVQDAQLSKATAQVLADELARVVKTITVTAPLNVFVRQGDQIYARLRFGAGRVFRQTLYVTSLTKRLQPGQAQMDIACSWRQYDAVNLEDTSGIATTGAAAAAAGANVPNSLGQINILAAAGGQTVGASQYGGPGDPTAGHVGYKGDDLNKHPDTYAELGVNGAIGNAMGGLPYMTPLRVTYGSKSAVLKKRDVGKGGDAVQGKTRAIDIWWAAAADLGFAGIGLVKVERVK